MCASEIKKSRWIKHPRWIKGLMALISITLTFYWKLSFSGPYRWIANLETRWFGKYYSDELVFILTSLFFLFLLIPACQLYLQVSVLRRQNQPAISLPKDLREQPWITVASIKHFFEWILDCITNKNIYHIVKSGLLTIFSIVLVSIMGAVFLPLMDNYLENLLIWFVASAFFAATYTKIAYSYHRHIAERNHVVFDRLSTFGDIGFEVLALIGGGFFGVLFGFMAWNQYHKTGLLNQGTCLLAGCAVIFLFLFCLTVWKSIRYVRHMAPAGK